MDVKKFVEKISSLEGDFDLIDGKYIVDARSLLGIFVMDLSKPIQLRIQKDSKNALKAIKEFVTDEPVAVSAGAMEQPQLITGEI
jgi:phosphotransferase system HPr-like phosphotransfer protein